MGAMTVEQMAAKQILDDRIRAAADRGSIIPCSRTPRWDQEGRPEDCELCPVFTACDNLWNTGLIRHATVLAGRRITPRADQGDSDQGDTSQTRAS